MCTFAPRKNYLGKQLYNMIKDIANVFRSSLFSGICVGIAGFGFLATRDIVGSILFAFGLLTVINYGLRLYTGTAGFIKKNEVPLLLLILLGNISGCFLVALLARMSPLPLQESAQAILQSRLDIGPLRGGILSIGCGFIMTTSITFARKGNNLPMLFGVPLFITCGFPHCVADSFYYMTTPCSFLWSNLGEILIFYVSIVLGNFIGCNLYRIIIKEEIKKG